MAYHKSPRRSRSPAKDPDTRRRKPHRSDSPNHHRHHHHRPSHLRCDPKPQPTILPFEAAPLRKADFATYKPIFALYLDIQKQLVMEELTDDEIKGRWKSFVGRWNRGELAEGWYEPDTLRKARASAAVAAQASRVAGAENPQPTAGDLSDDDVGPAPPRGRVGGSQVIGEQKQEQQQQQRAGPVIPSIQDLELRQESLLSASQTASSSLRAARLADLQTQKSQLDELLPRAEAGTQERRQENRRIQAENHRSFASAKNNNDTLPDFDPLQGEDNDGAATLQAQKHELERRKNEREIRREEIARARQAERDTRLREYRAREEKTMSGLIQLARAKFG